MHWTRKYVIAGGSILALAAGGTGAAIATSGSQNDESGNGQEGEQGQHEHGQQGDRQDEHGGDQQGDHPDRNGDHGATGPRAEQAKAAALRITGGGTANAVERDNENGATWEVEVTKPDGTTVDVRLDRSYNLVVIEPDSGG